MLSPKISKKYISFFHSQNHIYFISLKIQEKMILSPKNIQEIYKFLQKRNLYVRKAKIQEMLRRKYISFFHSQNHIYFISLKSKKNAKSKDIQEIYKFLSFTKPHIFHKSKIKEKYYVQKYPRKFISFYIRG